MKTAVKIILVCENKKIMLHLRDDKPEIPYPNHWSEIGGAIEDGEIPIQALNREISEEISCKVYDIKFLGEIIDKSENCKILYYKGRIFEKIEKIVLYEGQKLGVFGLNDLETILMPPTAREFILNNKEEIFN